MYVCLSLTNKATVLITDFHMFTMQQDSLQNFILDSTRQRGFLQDLTSEPRLEHWKWTFYLYSRKGHTQMKEALRRYWKPFQLSSYLALEINLCFQFLFICLHPKSSLSQSALLPRDFPSPSFLHPPHPLAAISGPHSLCVCYCPIS